MRARTVALRELVAARTWSVDRFVATASTPARDDSTSRPSATVPLRDLVRERREPVDPARGPLASRPYLGLEHVESRAGFLVGAPLHGRDVRSRSKRFEAGDLLYGRLRPNLNKVLLVDREFGHGSCSGEFHVLVADASRVDARWLRGYLAGAATQRFVRHRITGATHPRLPIEELLSLPVELPSLAQQRRAAARLDRLRAQQQSLRRKLAALPDALDEVVAASVSATASRARQPPSSSAASRSRK
jgi:type I restriction enzyme S subunit